MSKTAPPPVLAAAARELKLAVSRLAELKTSMSLDQTEWDSLRSKAEQLLESLGKSAYTLPGIGKIEISPNTPRKSLDQEALKLYFVEQFDLAPSDVVAAIEACTKPGQVKKANKVEFSLLDSAE